VRADRVVRGAPHGLPADARVAGVRRRSRTVSTTDATSATTPTTVSSRTKMAETAKPAPLALGASDRSSPQTVSSARSHT
jgi:hypothetical protein